MEKYSKKLEKFLTVTNTAGCCRISQDKRIFPAGRIHGDNFSKKRINNTVTSF